MKIGELFMELGFQADTEKLDDFISKVGTLDMKSLLAGAGLTGIFIAMKKIMDIANETALEMNKFNKITGMSAQRMKSWDKFAQKMGASGGIIAESLKKIQTFQTKLRHNQPDQGFIQGLYKLNQVGAGIDRYDDMFVMLDKMQKVWGKIHESDQRHILSLMGLNEEMTLFLDASEEAYETRNKYATVNQKDVEQLVKTWGELKDLTGDFSTSMTRLGAKMSRVLSPVIRLLDVMVKAYMKMHEIEDKIFNREMELPLKEMFSNNMPLALSSLLANPAGFMGGESKQNSGSPAGISAVFNITGNDVKAMKDAVVDAFNGLFNDSMNQLPPEGI